MKNNNLLSKEAGAVFNNLNRTISEICCYLKLEEDEDIYTYIKEDQFLLGIYECTENINTVSNIISGLKNKKGNEIYIINSYLTCKKNDYDINLGTFQFISDLIKAYYFLKLN